MATRQVTSRLVVSTKTSVNYPSRTFAAAAASQLTLASGIGRVYVNFGLPRDLYGKTILSATVFMWSDTQWPSPGGRTLTLQRISAPAAESYAAMTWNNAPAVLPGSTGVIGVADTPLSSKRYRWDVTSELQLIANGDEYNGFRLGTTDTTLRYFFGSAHPTAYPRLIIQYADETPAPQQIIPDGTVGVAKPTFVWDAPDDISFVKAQADVVDGTFAAPAWSSADIASIVGQVDTNAAGYGGLADAAAADFRFAQFGPLGWSEWSDPVTITRANKTTLTPSLPAPSGTTNDPTPVHEWTFANQTSWQLIVTDQNGKVWYDSGRTAGADQDATPTLSSRLPDLSTMTSTLRVWDNRTDRISSPGDLAYVEATWSWTLAVHSGTAAINSLTVTNPLTFPAPKLAWTRTAGEPDEWIIKRNGLLIDRFPGSQGKLTSTTWEFYDWTCPPNTTVEYQVIPMVGANGGLRGPTVTHLNEVEGLWVYQAAAGIYFCVAGDGVADGLELGDSSIIYKGPYATAPIKRHLALRGVEGDVEGYLVDVGDGRSVEDMLDDVEYVREHPTSTYRLIFGFTNVPVLITNLSAFPGGAEFTTTDPTHRISFQVDQNGEFSQAIA